ncbi:MAG: CinA family nicotinamide mononucleotide deamidase-related protein [Dysgonamonadaceae bacterium]|nr:CinA family nicotinamide mononucleotide deamidase-related protein [Dysgonamonadaceae bacterium]
MLQVEIITIGDELLIGQVLDTNSAWMAQELNKSGFDVRYKTTVGDVEEDILDAFGRAFSRASVILVTGGIGPTKDDITKKALVQFFKTTLIFDNATLETIKEVVHGNHKILNGLTRNQAYVPAGSTVIQNKAGTAPVTWFEKEGKILVSMPGVPYEMKWAMTNEILPRLQMFFRKRGFIRHQTFWVKDYSESMLAIHLETFENELPASVKLAYLPASGLIRLRLTGKDSDETGLNETMGLQTGKLKALLSGSILSEEDDNPENILDRILKEKGLTLSLAESCTGGKLASLFTAIPGCSRYFKGGVVSYSNDAKRQILGVRLSDIKKYGAVSLAVVEQMVLGARRIFNSDCAIAISGIAGPDGGTEKNPVGTVWIAVSCKKRLIARKFLFSNSRENNILRSCNNGIRMLLDVID